MEDLILVPITADDIWLLDKTEYSALTQEERRGLVEDSQSGLCRGEFFRFYIVRCQGIAVGVINMFGHGNKVVSVAPEIFWEHRGKGLATKSLLLSYEIAKGEGFAEVNAGIRAENVASQNLHVKLGFKYIEDQVSRHGNLLKIYSRSIN